jgi:hypothetical protein
MRVRRLLASVAVCGALGLVPAAAQAQGGPYTSAGSASGGVALAKGKTYNFCTALLGCPLTTWTMKMKKITDGVGDVGPLAKSGKDITVELEDGPGSGITCVFSGVKTKTGFNSEAAPGKYTCNGFEESWWAVKT